MKLNTDNLYRFIIMTMLMPDINRYLTTTQVNYMETIGQS